MNLLSAEFVQSMLSAKKLKPYSVVQHAYDAIWLL